MGFNTRLSSEEYSHALFLKAKCFFCIIVVGLAAATLSKEPYFAACSLPVSLQVFSASIALPTEVCYA